MNVFISHIEEEAKIALALKDWMELAFVGQCQVFVSGHDGNILADSEWCEKIGILEAPKVLMIICSPRSIQKPWINEVYHQFARRIPIIAVCHSGLEKAPLPHPLSEFQGIDLGQLDFSQKFLSILEKELGVAQSPGFLPKFYSLFLASYFFFSASLA